MRETLGSSKKTLKGVLAWILRLEIATLLLLGIAAGGIWTFLELADEVVEGETEILDTRLLLLFRNPHDHNDPIGPRWVEEAARDFTALGGMAVEVFLTLAMVGGLLILKKRHAAVFVILAIGGGLILSLLLKQGFDRPRPDLVPHGSYTVTSSFPSGHSMTSAVTYLTLGALLSQLLPGRRMKIYLVLLAAFLTCAVGISRVYLGVHWPTDVLAGWTGGVAWAVLCWIAVRFLQAHGQVEEEHQTTEEMEASE
jgi:undecaprenyl-diphosphatase